MVSPGIASGVKTQAAELCRRDCRVGLIARVASGRAGVGGTSGGGGGLCSSDEFGRGVVVSGRKRLE